jgi:hypothetical protein
MLAITVHLHHTACCFSKSWKVECGHLRGGEEMVFECGDCNRAPSQVLLGG